MWPTIATQGRSDISLQLRILLDMFPGLEGCSAPRHDCVHENAECALRLLGIPIYKGPRWDGTMRLLLLWGTVNSHAIPMCLVCGGMDVTVAAPSTDSDPALQ